MSKQPNTTTTKEARLFPFKLGETIDLHNKDFWKFPLEWILGIRLTKDQFEDDEDGFYSATIESDSGRMYHVSLFDKSFNKVFPKKNVQHPERCFAQCYITPKNQATDKMLGLDGEITDNIAMTIVGPDYPKKEVCQNLRTIRTQLQNNFDQAKTIATLAIEWCDSKELNECDQEE